MNSYQQRIEEELFSLSDRLQKLVFFINSKAFDTLSHEEQTLLDKQCDIMHDYANILQNRLEISKD